MDHQPSRGRRHSAGPFLETAQLLEQEIRSGQDVELKSFASEILPVVLGHLEMAQSIEAEMTGKTS